MTSILRNARSFLFVPANRPERLAKAFSCGADAVIVDLEDAVAPQDKTAARQHLAHSFSSLTVLQRERLLVRTNALGSPWYADDLAFVASLSHQGLGGLMPAKSELVHPLVQMAEAMAPSCALVPLVESVMGLDNLDALARVPQVVRLAFGHLDFQVDAGLDCDAQEAELVPVRLALVLASRRAGLASPIDGVTTNLQGSHQLQSDAKRARRGGFSGKLCIHPSQVEGVNTAFMPTPEELAKAQRVLAAFDAAGGGVLTLDGRMVDAPVLLLAQRTVAQSARR